jgi:putative Mn2+ efflux pump MntP
VNCTSLLSIFCWDYDLLNASAVAVEFGPILLSALYIILFLYVFNAIFPSLKTCSSTFLNVWTHVSHFYLLLVLGFEYKIMPFEKNVKTGKNYIQVYCQMNETSKFKLTHFVTKFSNKLSQFLVLFNCIFTNLDLNL